MENNNNILKKKLKLASAVHAQWLAASLGLHKENLQHPPLAPSCLAVVFPRNHLTGKALIIFFERRKAKHFNQIFIFLSKIQKNIWLIYRKISKYSALLGPHHPSKAGFALHVIQAFML